MEALAISAANLETIERNLGAVAQELTGVITNVNDVNNQMTKVEDKVEDFTENVKESVEEFMSDMGFEETKNKYTIKFVNWDNSELQSSEFEYGITPVYNGETPTKGATSVAFFTDS